MLNSIKNIIKKKLAPVNIQSSLLRLKNTGFSPDVIFDIGAYKGEFARLCLSIWPKSKIFCFEVLPHCIEELKQIANIEIIPSLVGEENKESVPFNIAETASSVLSEHTDQKFQVAHFPMIRLDSFCQRESIQPSFLKIDTQGYEYPVLKGLGDNLKDLEIILAELNFLDIHKDVVIASEVISHLHQHHFVPFDITEIHRRPLDQAIWQTDFLFCKEDSALRNDKRWNV